MHTSYVRPIGTFPINHIRKDKFSAYADIPARRYTTTKYRGFIILPAIICTSARTAVDNKKYCLQAISYQARNNSFYSGTINAVLLPGIGTLRHTPPGDNSGSLVYSMGLPDINHIHTGR